jgi:hypothetical protein
MEDGSGCLKNHRNECLSPPFSAPPTALVRESGRNLCLSFAWGDHIQSFQPSVACFTRAKIWLEESSLWLGCSSSTLFSLPQTGLSCRDSRPVTPLFAHIGSCIGSEDAALYLCAMWRSGSVLPYPTIRVSGAETVGEGSRDISVRDVVCTFIHTITTMRLSASTPLSLPNSIIGRLSIRAYAEGNEGVEVQKHVVSRYSGDSNS